MKPATSHLLNAFIALNSLVLEAYRAWLITKLHNSLLRKHSSSSTNINLLQNSQNDRFNERCLSTTPEYAVVSSDSARGG